MNWISNQTTLMVVDVNSACVPQFIPMPVLYGVFLYMGVASLNGVQVSPTLN